MKFDIPIFHLKRLAKIQSRQNNMPLHVALDEIAREHGFSDWQHLVFREKRERNAATVFKDLNQGDLLLMGARPKQGKTVLALQLLHKALLAGELAYVFSLEYTDAEVREQLHKLGMKPDDFTQTLNIDTSDDICADYISDCLNSCKRSAFVVVDYLQLLDQKRDNPDIESQVKRLAIVARESSSKIIVLSQIDRSFDLMNVTLPDVSHVRLPNTINLAHFGKTCFLHKGEMSLSASTQ